ncbi:hypothetical protein [Chamaesiphon sp. GL140_3_metabinner_50]|uniref:hypothetical protein n=1 Tax=Chamaesiphon sp. GL140_3_metabinner_50 TaxID=2970812 RepID=UPI0025D82FD6|nr:hypothetical protein [Chamaesiphon sp. GL140_3_metabinner_50]
MNRCRSTHLEDRHDRGERAAFIEVMSKLQQQLIHVLNITSSSAARSNLSTGKIQLQYSYFSIAPMHNSAF